MQPRVLPLGRLPAPYFLKTCFERSGRARRVLGSRRSGPNTSQSNSIRRAAKWCFTVGLTRSNPVMNTAATCIHRSPAGRLMNTPAMAPVCEPANGQVVCSASLIVADVRGKKITNRARPFRSGEASLAFCQSATRARERHRDRLNVKL